MADYIELGSYNAAAKKNGVSNHTVKRIVEGCPEISKKVQHKKEQNTADVLAYMDTKKAVICEILGKGLDVLNDEEKLREATPAQITTALGTLIDKWTETFERQQAKSADIEDMTAVVDLLKKNDNK